MTIISASRRTDIPAFYADWFMNRIKAEFFFKINPYNPQQKTGISLAVEDVDCIVFWTKHPQPMLEKGYLKKLDEGGYNYYFQYTLNDYPDFFEPQLPRLDTRLDCFKQLSSYLGAQRMIWRYDPIIVSNQTDLDFHLAKFEQLAEELSDYTERVIISFLDFYGKTKRKLNQLPAEQNIVVEDVVDQKEKLLFLSRRMKKIAEKNQLEIQTCGELDNASAEVIAPGSCIDAELIEDVFEINLDTANDANQREVCLCAKADDMGQYDTCRFACAYCYANQSKQAVEKKIEDHNPEGKVLVGSCEQKFQQQTTLF